MVKRWKCGNNNNNHSHNNVGGICKCFNGGTVQIATTTTTTLVEMQVIKRWKRANNNSQNNVGCKCFNSGNVQTTRATTTLNGGLNGGIEQTTTTIKTTQMEIQALNWWKLVANANDAGTQGKCKCLNGVNSKHYHNHNNKDGRANFVSSCQILFRNAMRIRVRKSTKCKCRMHNAQSPDSKRQPILSPHLLERILVTLAVTVDRACKAPVFVCLEPQQHRQTLNVRGTTTTCGMPNQHLPNAKYQMLK